MKFADDPLDATFRHAEQESFQTSELIPRSAAEYALDECFWRIQYQRHDEDQQQHAAADENYVCNHGDYI